MNFFKKGTEFNKLAKAFNGLYQMIKDLENNLAEDSIENLLIIAYLGRKEIIDRIEEYKWNLNSYIIVPMIPGKKITIANALQQTIVRITELSISWGCENDIQEILDKGYLFFELEKSVPGYLKNMV